MLIISQNNEICLPLFNVIELNILPFDKGLSVTVVSVRWFCYLTIDLVPGISF